MQLDWIYEQDLGNSLYRATSSMPGAVDSGLRNTSLPGTDSDMICRSIARSIDLPPQDVFSLCQAARSCVVPLRMAPGMSI
jgi:hypothetical protein